MSAAGRLIAWIDRRNFIAVRSAVLYVCVWMTWKATAAAWAFVEASKFDGTGTAAIVAAVMAPVAALNGYVFGWYADSRREQKP